MAKKKSEWGWLRGKYPDLPLDPTYDEAVSAARTKYIGYTAEMLATEINVQEVEKDKIEQKLSGVNLEITALERLMLERFDATGVESITVGGHSFKPQVSPYPFIADPVAMRAWYEEHMPERLNVAWQSVKGDIAAALRGEGDIPEGVEVKTSTVISRRKSG
jgi:hypothetical protein